MGRHAAAFRPLRLAVWNEYAAGINTRLTRSVRANETSGLGPVLGQVLARTAVMKSSAQARRQQVVASCDDLGRRDCHADRA
jgi:hypothetical protein